MFVDTYRDVRGPGMPLDISEGFGDDKVRAHLDRWREAPIGVEMDIELTWNRAPAGDPAEGRAQTSLGQHGRVNAPCQFAKLLKGHAEARAGQLR